MKVNELLLEKTRIKTPWTVEKIKIDAAINLLNEKCRASLNDIASGHILWRGMNNIGKIATLDSTKSYRTSKDTNNLYQLGMETSKNLQHIPHRSKSFVCSTSRSIAEGYGYNIYVLFPFDNTPIAVSTEDDFIGTFVKGIGDIQNFNSLQPALSQMNITPDFADKFTDASRIDEKLSNIDPRAVIFAFATAMPLIDKYYLTYKNFVKEYNSVANVKIKGPDIHHMIATINKIGAEDKKHFDNCFSFVKLSAFGQQVFNAIVANPKKKFTATCNVIFTEQTMRFKIVKPGSISPITEGSECWFSGKCVAIEERMFAQIVKEMVNRKMKVDYDIIDALEDYMG